MNIGKSIDLSTHSKLISETQGALNGFEDRINKSSQDYFSF